MGIQESISSLYQQDNSNKMINSFRSKSMNKKAEKSAERAKVYENAHLALG